MKVELVSALNVVSAEGRQVMEAGADWTGELAQVETARGYQVGDYLFLQIAGEKPSPCHVVDIKQNPTDVFPPQFSATLFVDPRVRCIQVVTRYERAEVFAVAGLAGKTVQLDTGGGQIAIEVEEVIGQEPADGGDSPFDDIGEPGEAVGYSPSWDLAEAVRDAIGQLPSRGGHIADWLNHYEVVSIEAEIGGIAGFNHLKVRVRG
jgi:hypothetical protein